MSNFARPPLPLLIVLSLRGVWLLALARWALHRIGPGGVMERNAAARRLARPQVPQHTAEQCQRVAFAIPRIARRLPWRADCLVQALAGQAWLSAEGIGAEIVVGTARGADGRFEAHAWLQDGDVVILGGDISRFEPLLKPDPALFKPGL